MAFLPGLKKQFNKANQYMTEHITGVEGTKLDNEYHDMERQTDLYNELIQDLQSKTKEFLQPNPTVRVKMAAVKSISSLSGQVKSSTYPQPEGTLGEAMYNYGCKLQNIDSNSIYAASLIESGESLKQMADMKYALDDNVKQNFLEPMHHMQTKDLKEVLSHRKKLHGRKLDFDCKKRKGACTEEELGMAEEKFSESLNLAQVGMHNLLEGSSQEHISQLSQFANSLLDYHTKCADILQGLTDILHEKSNEASVKHAPCPDFQAKDLGIKIISKRSSQFYLNSRTSSQMSLASSDSPRASSLVISTPSPASAPTPPPRPCCQALYDFAPEVDGELGFNEGDVILLKSQIDENWYNGSFNGNSGYFPVNYVTVINPLP